MAKSLELPDINVLKEKLKAYLKEEYAAHYTKLAILNAEIEAKTTERDALQMTIDMIEHATVGDFSSKRKGKAAKAPSNGTKAFSASVDTVVKFIKENAGTAGVATRRLTAEYGKPDDGWDSILHGKATLKGKGSAGKWHVK